MCIAVGAEGTVVDGSHSWLLADPGPFVEVITNDLEVAKRGPGAGARRRRRAPRPAPAAHAPTSAEPATAELDATSPPRGQAGGARRCGGRPGGG